VTEHAAFAVAIALLRTDVVLYGVTGRCMPRVGSLLSLLLPSHDRQNALSDAATAGLRNIAIDALHQLLVSQKKSGRMGVASNLAGEKVKPTFLLQYLLKL
jgi:hypothetical protein